MPFDIYQETGGKFPKRKTDVEGNPEVSTAEKLLFQQVNNEVLEGDVDVVVWIEGDATDRVRQTVEIYRRYGGDVPVVLSGGLEGNAYRPDSGVDSSGGNIPATRIKSEFVANGVPDQNIILETESKNAHEQAVNVVLMAQERGWKRIVLVASPWHQMRLFLSFLSELKAKHRLDIELVNQPDTSFPPEREVPGRGKTTSELIPEELGRIDQYQTVGHVVSPNEGLEYLATFPDKKFRTD